MSTTALDERFGVIPPDVAACLDGQDKLSLYMTYSESHCWMS
jgi:hypothetical protein